MPRRIRLGIFFPFKNPTQESLPHTPAARPLCCILKRRQKSYKGISRACPLAFSSPNVTKCLERESLTRTHVVQRLTIHIVEREQNSPKGSLDDAPAARPRRAPLVLYPNPPPNKALPHSYVARTTLDNLSIYIDERGNKKISPKDPFCVPQRCTLCVLASSSDPRPTLSPKDVHPWRRIQRTYRVGGRGV